LWVGYWTLPLPNQFGSLWVNFNSPLLWDVFAISTYLSVSLVFWYIGLIPDFATIRDRAKKPVAKKMYSILSFGWSGRAKHWNRFELVSLVLAGLATPLVFSVHSIVFLAGTPPFSRRTSLRGLSFLDLLWYKHSCW
jgi:Ni/Fe-hydrogenase subunit HybB-like protein